MTHRWTIGIDPGFGQTGVVLLRGPEVKEFAVYSRGPGEPAFQRTAYLGEKILNTLHQWLLRYGIERLDVAIETPIWKKNAHNFELQWRLVHHIEFGLWVWVSSETRLWVTEVPPTTSKKLATGDGRASKETVAEASPFLRANFPDDTTWTTLGDAWAHSRAAWGGCPNCVRRCYSDLRTTEV